MDSISLGSILTFLSGGVIGGFIGGATKFFWEKYLPDRMTWRRDLETQRKKSLAQHGGPAVRAIHELQQRIYVMVLKHPRRFDTFSQEDREYEMESLAFLVAQCCARLEVLRGKMEALDYAKLVDKLDPISRNLAGYGRKFPMHRLQQQEIAELMLSVSDTGDLYCLGYSKFLATLRNKETLECWSRLERWSQSILEHWPEEVVRLVNIQHALVDALNFLDAKYNWVASNKRNKLWDTDVVDGLVRHALIDEQKANNLRQQFEANRLNAK